jgi:hypothetical protein
VRLICGGLNESIDFQKNNFPNGSLFNLTLRAKTQRKAILSGGAKEQKIGFKKNLL